jgi:hypothetical protein
VNDLTADLAAELAPPPVAAAPSLPRRPRPACSVAFTPLHWARPSVTAPPTGAGVVLRGGPWQVDVLL